MPELQSAPLGELLRRFRLTAGLSQEGLAERAGLSARGISDLERGRRLAPHLETVRLLVSALNLSEAERAALIAAARPELHQAAGFSQGQREASAWLSVSRSPSFRALPIPPTRLIGREQVVSEIRALYTTGGARLITLTGPGGVGKTRVCLDVAGSLAPFFANGAVFVDLAALSSAAQVSPAILDALDFQGSHGVQPDQQLVEALRDKVMLLALDNYEHLLDAATAVSELLMFCPGVSMIVTSRVRLKLRGETVYPVPPLEVPAEITALAVKDLAALSESPAVRLFVERARESSFGFAWSEQNADAIISICRRLDGLPLAIELAASWLRILTPEELLERLNRRLPALGGGARDAPARQQTLRDTIAWSLENLTVPEQRLFRQLAVFSGGTTFDAIRFVTSAGSASNADLLDTLSSLVDNSLVRQSEDVAGEARFSMLETIREFARELLDQSEEGDAIQAAMVEWIRDLAEQAEPELVGPRETYWRALLTADQGNIRSALTWSITRGDFETGLRIGGALWRFWSKRGDLLEGQDWLTQVLEIAGEPESELHAKALQALANVTFDLGDYPAARISFEASLTIRRTLPNKSLIANALNGLGLVAFAEGDLERARQLHQESLSLSREVGSLIGIGNSLSNWADVEKALGQFEKSKQLQEEALGVRRELGDDNSIAYSLYNLGSVARAENRPHEALDLFEEALELFHSAGDLFGVGFALCDLAVIRNELGYRNAGASAMIEAIALRQDIGDQRGLIDCLEGTAAIAASAKLDFESVMFIGGASASRERLHAPRSPAEQQDLQRWVDAILERLGEERYQMVLAQGHAMSIQKSITLARDTLQQILDSGAGMLE